MPGNEQVNAVITSIPYGGWVIGNDKQPMHAWVVGNCGYHVIAYNIITAVFTNLNSCAGVVRI